MFLHEDSQAYRDAEDERFGKQGGGWIRTPRNDTTRVASFADYEKLRDGCTVTVNKIDEHEAWKRAQEREDRRWREEQRLGFCPDEEARNYNAHL